MAELNSIDDIDPYFTAADDECDVQSEDYIVLAREDEDLVDKTVSSDEQAFELYNTHALKYGFGVRKARVRRRAKTGEISMRLFFCNKQGLKKEDVTKAYTKLAKRTGCKAHIRFHAHKDGTWIVVNHMKEHNHEFTSVGMRHLISSHRKVNPEQLAFITNMRESGVRVSDALRIMRKEAGGSPNVGFTSRDAYNALGSSSSKKLDVCDARVLVKIFAQRQVDEDDFYYDVEMDDEGHLVSFFFRDGTMRRDYDCFGDLLVHDTTYRTNKYGLICGPFIGMNQHAQNIMFGIGFLLNEKIESFEWLFGTFLRSMGGKQPVTVMTDQAFSMAAAIKTVFPQAKHRLCTWHIGENSCKHLKILRNKLGFTDMFNYVLKYCDTKAEFNFYWLKMLRKYQCFTNKWLRNLWKIREKWCPAFSKEYFSGGILSSQRCETTNKSISQRLDKTDDLNRFYQHFLDVVAEWRSRENGEDFRCTDGNKVLAFAGVKILLHAREIYTIEIYGYFEKQFSIAMAMVFHGCIVDGAKFIYLVYRPDVDYIKHQVVFNKLTLDVECTCMMFTEVGYLCSHCLSVFHHHHVLRIPEKYILKRWTKAAMCKKKKDESQSSTSTTVLSSVWRTQISREFIRLIMSSQHNEAAREQLDIALKDAKEAVLSILGPPEDVPSEEVNKQAKTLLDIEIKNPNKSRGTYQRNTRPKSIIEKKRKQAKGWKNRVYHAILETRARAQSSVQDDVNSFARERTLVHPIDHNLGIMAIDKSDYPSSSADLIVDTSSVSAVAHGARLVNPQHSVFADDYDPYSCLLNKSPQVHSTATDENSPFMKEFDAFVARDNAVAAESTYEITSSENDYFGVHITPFN